MDVVSELLRSSLLTELGDDKERVDRVRAAARAMAIDLATGSRHMTPSTVIAAIDERTTTEAAVLDAAANHLLEVWETFRIAFPAPPVEILRAVAFAALVDAAKQDDALMHAAWYTARTAVELVPVGRWAAPVADVVTQWQTPVATAITARWVPVAASPSLRMPNLQPTEDKAVKVNTPLRARATSLTESGNWQTFGQELMGEFAQLVDGLVSISESLAAESQRRAISQVKEFAVALGARLRDALGAQDQAIAAIELRSTLLWWHKSQFSERLLRHYGEMASPADLAIAAAYDLHLMVPPVAPIAVEHLLADLVASAAKRSTKLRFGELASSAEVATLPSGADHRATPATLIGALVGGTTTPLLDEKTAITPARASVLLFRDLQAQRLAVPPPVSAEEPQ